ncbi:MAG: ABC transporter ATP-binding protein [Spirochaetia bacterium]|nr:ABC transporter ATP-binding protein [Spirochaetia bacterium]
MTLIQTKGLHKVFYQGEIAVNALQGIDLSIEKGEFTSLVGPSGSGKTTLLNIIGALDRQTSGEIIVGGQDLSRLSNTQLSDFRLHNIGFVFQAYNLIPVLTAIENVEYILMISGIKKSERISRSKEILNDVGLSEEIDRFPAQLSGGQQQRVAVARALVSDPEIVLADEPTANLDSENADILLDIMKKMCDERKTTFLFSTHDTRVMERARRLIKLRDGLIAEQ